jgi:putative Mn2+ efflux pump MntP
MPGFTLNDETHGQPFSGCLWVFLQLTKRRNTMGFLEIFILGVGLSMDAFAVSICKGLSLGKIKVKHMCIAGVWFGGFQALMPILGYYLGSLFSDLITKYSHWVAFILLAFIGGKMIKEAFETEQVDASMDVKTMFILAVATSIDAIAVGVTFAFLDVNIWLSACIIGVTTFVFSAAGVKIGSLFGEKYKSKAEIAGGIILILIGVKILLSGLGIIA